MSKSCTIVRTDHVSYLFKGLVSGKKGTCFKMFLTPPFSINGVDKVRISQYYPCAYTRQPHCTQFLITVDNINTIVTIILFLWNKWVSFWFFLQIFTSRIPIFTENVYVMPVGTFFLNELQSRCATLVAIFWKSLWLYFYSIWYLVFDVWATIGVLF